MRLRIFQQYLNRLAIIGMLAVAVPTIAWADFLNYARYLELELVPEVQLINDAYRHSRDPGQSKIRALNNLLSIKQNSADVLKKNALLLAQARLYLSSLYFTAGQYTKAEQVLLDTYKIIQDLGNRKIQLHYYYQLGMLALSRQSLDAAKKSYLSARQLSEELNNPLMLALTRQALGEVQLLSGNTKLALSNFKSAYKDLRDLDRVILAGDAGILYFALKSKLDNWVNSDIDLAELISLVRLTPDEPKRLQQMSELFDTYHSLQNDKLNSSIQNKFHRLAEELLQLARKLNNTQSKLLVARDLVKRYERSGNYAEALRLVQETLGDNKDSITVVDSIPLYLRQARLFTLMNRDAESIFVYQTALRLLKNSMLNKNRANVQRLAPMLGEVYDALISLYFIRSHAITEEVSKQAALNELRDYIEERNYFYFKTLLNEGYADFALRKNSISVLSRKAALVYPVVFDDRLEILVSLPDGIKCFTTKVNRVELLRAKSELRKTIEQADKKIAYKKSAIKLYRWLIVPIRQQLLRQNISSLVFVLDKTLANLPTSALFDKKGRRYLVEQYALAVTPGLMLTDANLRRRKRGSMLYLGQSTDTREVNTTQLIDREMERITATTRVSVHVNEIVSHKQMSKVVSDNDYSTIHISVPLSIESEFTKSYVGNLGSEMSLVAMLGTLKSAKQRRPIRQLELTVLSASKTKSQNTMSDGGILTIAHKLGSRSAVASLWMQVSEATSLFMSEFYTNLSASSISTATAIRRAKMRLIASKQYQHPAYWARYELIGSWL